MDKSYMAILWGAKDERSKEEYKIEAFENLQEAIKFLIAYGAYFEHQEIVQKINWLPGSPQKTAATPSQDHEMTPEERELATKPNPKGSTEGQPLELGPDGKPLPQRPLAISERLPKGMMGLLMHDKD